MKTYKKPVSILVKIDLEEMIAMSLEGQTFNGGTPTDATKEDQLPFSGSTGGDVDHGDAKGFDSWE